MVVALAFGAFAGLIQYRTKKVNLLWVSWVFALVAGLIILRTDGPIVANYIGGILSWGPGLIGCAALGVTVVDISDRKPNIPAAVAAVILPTFWGPAWESFLSGSLPAAITLGALAGIFYYRSGEGGKGGKGSNKLRWLSLGVALFGGIAFAITEYASIASDTLNGWHSVIPGTVGLLAIGIIICDLLDKRPDQASMIGMYLLPTFFVPAVALVGTGLSMIGG